jgi:predicted DNA-binding transcriptional regulator AlpA
MWCPAGPPGSMATGPMRGPVANWRRMQQTDPEHLTADDLARRWSVSAWTVYRLYRAGKTPPVLQLNSRALRWRESDVAEWEAEHVVPAGAERTAALSKSEE